MRLQGSPRFLIHIKIQIYLLAFKLICTYIHYSTIHTLSALQQVSESQSKTAYVVSDDRGKVQKTIK
jgi:hypothetical protein